jgi:hypothetical protein
MRGLNARSATASGDGVPSGVPARRRGTLLPKLVLLLLIVMIVRDIVVRRWSGGPAPRADVTRPTR